MSQTSLADAAVDVLAAVRAMDTGVENSHDERHQIRGLKRVAEQILANAFRDARDLAFIAEDVRRDAEAKRAATTKDPS